MSAGARNPLLLETTKVDAMKSIGEIVEELVRRKASSIETLYEAGKPIGLKWTMTLYDRPVIFRMPAKVTPVYEWLRRRRSGYVGVDRERQLREQAERVTWRQMLTWVKVQMALIDLGMVEYAQVFLPYVTDERSGMTFWDAAKESRFKAIEAPKQ